MKPGTGNRSGSSSNKNNPIVSKFGIAPAKEPAKKDEKKPVKV